MNGPHTHHEIEELLGAYALDAVDGDEREIVEAHLTGCPRCRGEVAAHRETAALLAHTGAAAPEGVWHRISESLNEPPPPLTLAPSAPRLAGAAEARRERRSISLRTAGAILAVAAAVSAFLGIRIVEQDQRIDRLTVGVREDGLRRAALAALAEPEAEELWLRSPDGTGAAAAHLVRLPDGTAFMVGDTLAPLPAGRTYQLWALRDDAKISLAVLGSDPDLAAFRMVGPVHGFAITEEMAGGVDTTDRPPVVLGTT